MKHISLPSNINYCQISDFTLVQNFEDTFLSIEILDPILNNRKINISFTKIIFFSISYTPGDNEGPFVIGSFSLVKKNIIKSEMKDFGYKFIPLSNRSNEEYYHLSTEGDICMIVISSEYLIEEMPIHVT